MTADQKNVTVVDTTANPAPLGLLGFGMTTMLLNFHNAGMYENNGMIMGMGIFVGGAAQVVAGILESKKNNTFGTTAFCAYGFFWMSLVALWIIGALNPAWATEAYDMGFYLAVWGLFTGGMFIGTLKQSKANQFIFASLTLLFFMLAIADFTDSKALKIAAGYEGIVCGASALYTAVAQVVNEIYGKSLLPIGEPKA